MRTLAPLLSCGVLPYRLMRCERVEQLVMSYILMLWRPVWPMSVVAIKMAKQKRLYCTECAY